MEKQPAKATGQQDTNAALAALAAAGNSFALGQLWEINKGLLHRLFWQWYSKNKAVADSAGLTIEDFDQEAFLRSRLLPRPLTRKRAPLPRCLATMCKTESAKWYAVSMAA